MTAWPTRSMIKAYFIQKALKSRSMKKAPVKCGVWAIAIGSLSFAVYLVAELFPTQFAWVVIGGLLLVLLGSPCIGNLLEDTAAPAKGLRRRYKLTIGRANALGAALAALFTVSMLGALEAASATYRLLFFWMIFFTAVLVAVARVVAEDELTGLRDVATSDGDCEAAENVKSPRADELSLYLGIFWFVITLVLLFGAQVIDPTCKTPSKKKKEWCAHVYIRPDRHGAESEKGS